ncbi:hypothetical protein L596_010331 [Steinernema carpocapsae]|uniref:Uncharacterized protein n=1 Tax=Steinernema carpocapsae TaxID=34508 RepID=A0A4U5PIJ8_STECR|nr:hypothetical protein L596_010331 [Steinernema carpocapsae]
MADPVSHPYLSRLTNARFVCCVNAGKTQTCKNEDVIVGNRATPLEIRVLVPNTTHYVTLAKIDVSGDDEKPVFPSRLRNFYKKKILGGLWTEETAFTSFANSKVKRAPSRTTPDGDEVFDGSENLKGEKMLY